MVRLFMLIICLFSSVASAQTYKYLSVPDLTTVTLTKQDSPHYLANAEIRGTLIVEPGVEVIMTNSARITIFHRGVLMAAGTASEPIRFRSLVGGWQGIETVFRSTSKSVIRMSYVDLGYVTGIGNAGMSLNNTNILADNVSITMDAKDVFGKTNIGIRFLSTLINGIKYDAVGELVDSYVTGPAVGIDNDSGVDLTDITYIGTGNPYIFKRKPVMFSVNQ